MQARLQGGFCKAGLALAALVPGGRPRGLEMTRAPSVEEFELGVAKPMKLR